MEGGMSTASCGRCPCRGPGEWRKLQRALYSHNFTVSRLEQRNRRAWHSVLTAAAAETRQSNLGALERFAQPQRGEAAALTEFSDFNNFTGGARFDAPAVFGSGLLLAVLLAIAFERVLGLDRAVLAALRSWRNSKQEKIAAARERLERQFGDSED